MRLTDLTKRAKEVIRDRLHLGTEQVRISSMSDLAREIEKRPLATPPVDVYENDRELVIVADVVGADHDNTYIAWDSGNGLVMYAHAAEPIAEAALTAESEEARDWYRAFELPDHLDGAEAQATLREGVLTVRVPRRRGPGPRLVPVTESR